MRRPLLALLIVLSGCGGDEDLHNTAGLEPDVGAKLEETNVDSAADATIEQADTAVEVAAEVAAEVAVAADDADDAALVDTAVEDAPDGSDDADASEDADGCTLATDCPGADTECRKRACVAGKCGTTDVASGTVLVEQTPGDCKRNVCDGKGDSTTVADETDAPNDSNECTVDKCTGATTTFTPAAAGTVCSAGSCNGAGACVGCITPAACPGTDTECRTRTCVSNTCGMAYVAAGTLTSVQTAGDCRRNQCNGAGAIVSVADATDRPNDAKQCTTDACTGTTPTHTPVTTGTTCTSPADGYCNALGNCVQCLTASTCPGTDTACRSRRCISGVCSMAYVASGTATPAQTVGDCKRVVCNGSGGTTTVTDTSDEKDDMRICTTDSCSGSTPIHTNRPDGTACGPGNCYGGTCVVVK